MVETHLGPKGMLLMESACGLLGILVFAVATVAWRPRPVLAATVPASG